MADKKPGFFKRLFKFGKAKKEEPEAESPPIEEAVVEQVPSQEEIDRAAAVEAEEIAAAKAEQARQEQIAIEAAEAEAAREQAAALAESEAIERAKAQQDAEAARVEAEAQAKAEAAERAKIEAAETARLKAEAEQARLEQIAKDEAEARLAEATEQKRLAEQQLEREQQAETERLAQEAEAAEQQRLADEAAALAEREAIESARQEQIAEDKRREREALEVERAAQAKAQENARLEAEAEKARLEQVAQDEAEASRKAVEAEEEKRLAAEAEAAKPEPTKKSWFSKLRDGLSRSSSQLTENITSVFTKRKLDEDTLQELEDILIQADLGVETAMNITDALASQRMGKDITDEEVREFMASEVEKVLEPVAAELELDLDHTPHVMLVVGVNGSGKTTTIGKLSQKLYDAGFSTLLVAGDTFRAAAIEQLRIWGERTQSPVVSRPLGSDAAGLAFDAYTQAAEEGRDVMLMDTAGRLQNKTELMDELEKIIRVLRKQDPTAPHTVLLTLDATTGQNALNQVEIFKDVAGVNGLVMTKLDGTARGGIMVAISAKFKLPVYFIGVGEQVDDLEPFEARDFARSIAGLDR